MIISSIEHIQVHTDGRTQMYFENIKPLISMAARKYILPLIPQELYDALDALPEPPINSVAVYDTLLLRLRAALANFLLALYVPRSEVNFGATGLLRNEGENDKTPYKYQSAAVQRSYFSAAYDALDAFMAYLNDNATVVAEYNGSAAQAQFQASLISSALEFSQLVAVRHPELILAAIRSDLDNVETLVMMVSYPLVYQDIKNKLSSGTALSIEERHLLSLFKNQLANAALLRALPRLSVRIEDGGITVISNDTSYVDAGARAADGNALTALGASLLATANEYATLAINYLNANPTAFPAWVNSSSSRAGFQDYSGLGALSL